MLGKIQRLESVFGFNTNSAYISIRLVFRFLVLCPVQYSILLYLQIDKIKLWLIIHKRKNLSLVSEKSFALKRRRD